MEERIPFDRTQPFNQLPLLPPPEGEVITIPILTKLAGANRLLGKLEGISAQLPNPNMLINTISLQEARSSSEIENIFTTDDELYKALTDRIREENANPATKEVLRYRDYHRSRGKQSYGRLTKALYSMSLFQAYLK